MATKPPVKGGLQDPLNKWDSLESIRKVASSDVLAAQLEVTRLRDSLQQPNLSHGQRLALSKSLIDATTSMTRAKRVSSRVLKDLATTRRLDEQINFRLSAIKAFMSNKNGLDAQIIKSLSATKKSLEGLKDQSKDLSGSLDSVDDLLEHVQSLGKDLDDIPKTVKKDLEKQIEELGKKLAKAPDDKKDGIKAQIKGLEDRLKGVVGEQLSELKDALDANKRALQAADAQRAKAQKFLDDHKKSMRDMRAGIYKAIGKAATSATMAAADRMGVGALNLGNALRAVGAAGKGMKSAYSGAKYLKQLHDARKIVKANTGPTPKEKPGKRVDLLAKWRERRAEKALARGKDKVQEQIQKPVPIAAPTPAQESANEAVKATGPRFTPKDTLDRLRAEAANDGVLPYRTRSQHEKVGAAANDEPLRSPYSTKSVLKGMREAANDAAPTPTQDVKAIQVAVPATGTDGKPAPTPAEATAEVKKGNLPRELAKKANKGARDFGADVLTDNKSKSVEEAVITAVGKRVDGVLGKVSDKVLNVALRIPKEADAEKHKLRLATKAFLKEQVSAFSSKSVLAGIVKDQLGITVTDSSKKKESDYVPIEVGKVADEVMGVRMELKSGLASFAESNKDELTVNQDIADQIQKYVRYTETYQRRMLDAVKSSGGGAASSGGSDLLGTLLGGGLASLIDGILPGLSAVLASSLGRKLVGMLAGRVLKLIWAALRGGLGPLSKVLLGAADGLIAASAVFLKKGTELLVELGKKVGQKVVETGSRALGAARTVAGVLGVSGVAAGAALITAPIAGYMWQEQLGSAEGLKGRIKDRKARIAELEEIIKIQKEQGARPQAYAKDEKSLEQHYKDLKDLEDKLKAKEGEAAGTSTGTAVKNDLPVSAAGGGRGSISNNNGTPYLSPSASQGPFRASNGSSVSQETNKLFELRKSADIERLDPSFRQRLNGAAQEYYEKTGKRLPINSGYRTFEQQAEEYRTKGPKRAAAPGKSMHNYGQAADTDSQVGDALDRMGLLKKYGIERPLKHEPWHLQPTGVTLAAAKAGILNGDRPGPQQQEATATPVKAASSAPSTAGTIAPPTAKATGSPLAITEPSPPNRQVEQPAVAETVGVNPNRLSTSMGSNPKYGVRDIPTFDQSDSLLLAMNLGVIG